MSDASNFQLLTDPVGPYACPACGVNLDVAGHAAFSPFTCPSCHAEILVPARLGSFLLLELLGTGGMGAAYRARDESLNRDVAIKVMHKRLGDDPAFLQTFRHEAQAAARLNHPNVVQIHSFGEAKGQPYIVMELVSGGSLDRLISAGEPLDEALVMRIGAEIAAALQHGYRSQLVHGDVKPENILLDEKGAAKLVDFGIAQLAGGNSEEVWGTPYYVAPEKVRRQRTDCRSDIYSLGGTLFHALSGQPPFDGADATAVVKARFLAPARPLRELRADIDPEVEMIVARMLQVDPAMRYPTYESLLGDMQRFLDRVKPAKVASRKMMFIRKKGASTTGPQSGAPTTGGLPTTTGPVPAVPAQKQGKLVIQAGSASTKLYATPAETPEETPAADASSGPPRWLIPLIVGLGIFIFAGICTGVWLLMRLHGSHGAAENSAVATTNQASSATAQVQARQAALDRLQASAGQADTAHAHLAAWAAEGGGMVTAAVHAVVGVLGSETLEQMMPPQPPASTNEPDATANADPDGLPPVVVKARAMHRAWYRLEALAETAGETAVALASNVTLTGAAAATNNTPEAWTAMADAAEAGVRPFAGTFTDEAKRKLAALRNDLGVVSNQVAVLAEEKRKHAIEETKLEAQRKLDEAARKAAEARQAAIQTETNTVRAKERDVLELLHKHAYNDARRQLRSLLPDLTFEESRKALDTALERANRLEDLRDFLAKRLPGYQHPDGWRIETADKEGLMVAKGREPAQQVLWADVGDVRMVLFIRHFLTDEQQTRELKLREQVQELINAAMYCRFFITGSKTVQDLTDKMLEQATTLLPDAKIDINRLMPADDAGVKADAAK